MAVGAGAGAGWMARAAVSGLVRPSGPSKKSVNERSEQVGSVRRARAGGRTNEARRLTDCVCLWRRRRRRRRRQRTERTGWMRRNRPSPGGGRSVGRSVANVT